jgi:formate hydrogenlyase subunit 6/NADH:ubiquinone oxidoreductase subunit I
MRYPKLRELAEAVRAIFKGPYTSRFPAEPHVPHPNFRGQPTFDREKCLGCLACEEACPTGAISHRDDIGASGGLVRVMIHYTDTCIYCSQCEAACINNHEGIKLTNEWELSYFNRGEAFETIEKQLQLCEGCGTAIGTTDHLEWLAQRLGELSYSNPTIYLTNLRSLGFTDPDHLPSLGEEGRSDRMKILCARCRRETSRYDDK